MIIESFIYSMSRPMVIFGVIIGLVSMLLMSWFRQTTVESTVPAGTVASVNVFPGQAALIGLDNPNRSVVVTDTGRYVVTGIFNAAAGQHVELRKAIDKTGYLCVIAQENACFTVEPDGGIATQ